MRGELPFIPRHSHRLLIRYIVGLNRRMPPMLRSFSSGFFIVYVGSGSMWLHKHLRCIVFGHRCSVSVIFLLYVCRSANHFRFYVYVEGIPVTFMTMLRTVLPNEVVLSL